jgi:leucyl-tRNA synthetase
MRQAYYEPSAVVERDYRWFAASPEANCAVEKMSKSRLNVANPDDIS